MSDALRAGLRANWTQGDFGEIARFAQPAADAFVERLALRPGERVADIACGTGNLAVPAARAGARVSGIDIAPNLIEAAAARAAAEGLTIHFDEGDAESLPYDDASFDTVLSMFWVMFAPDQHRAAAELLRVCRPGGRIALASWTPDGFVGRMFALGARFVPPPAGVASPLRWGRAEDVAELLRDAAELQFAEGRARFDLPFGPAQTVAFYRRCFGPTLRAFAALDAAGQTRYADALEELWREANIASDATPVWRPRIWR